MTGRVLYLVTEDWFFASHFLPLARAAAALGLEPVVATRVRDHRAVLQGEGIRVLPLEWERRAVGPLALAAERRRLAALMRAETPAIVHCIALRTILVGGAAGRRARVPGLVVAPTGLGHFWIEQGLAAMLGRAVIRREVRRLRGPGTIFLFENREDPAALGLSANDPNVRLIAGSGVDPAAFPPQPVPAGDTVRIALVGRMLRSKGVGTAVEAVSRMRAGGLPVELHLFGAPDPANPASVGEAELRRWSGAPGIAWHGPTADVAAVWRDADIAVLPSRREGLPRSLVEAMASGRPVVATDVPGCRELVRHDVEGLLVPPDDPAALAAALARLAADPQLRQRMGAAARRRFEAGYTTAAVSGSITAVYRELLRPG